MMKMNSIIIQLNGFDLKTQAFIPNFQLLLKVHELHIITVFIPGRCSALVKTWLKMNPKPITVNDI